MVLGLVGGVENPRLKAPIDEGALGSTVKSTIGIETAPRRSAEDAIFPFMTSGLVFCALLFGALFLGDTAVG